MKIIIILVVFVSIYYFCRFLLQAWQEHKRQMSIFSENEFAERNEITGEIKDFAEKLFKTTNLSMFHQGTGKNQWDQESWFLHVDTGGSDDPPTYLLTWRQNINDIPNFVIGNCVGITKIGKMINLLCKNSWKTLGLELLPDELQPFLYRKKGLLLYSNKKESLINNLPNIIFAKLNNSKLDISFIHFDGRMGCWTQKWNGIANLFKTSKLIKSNIQK